jgi:hypothetical protein
MSGPGSG